MQLIALDSKFAKSSSLGMKLAKEILAIDDLELQNLLGENSLANHDWWISSEKSFELFDSDYNILVKPLAFRKVSFLSKEQDLPFFLNEIDENNQEIIVMSRRKFDAWNQFTMNSDNTITTINFNNLSTNLIRAMLVFSFIKRIKQQIYLITNKDDDLTSNWLNVLVSFDSILDFSLQDGKCVIGLKSYKKRIEK